jgi:hypothetical protein
LIHKRPENVSFVEKFSGRMGNVVLTQRSARFGRARLGGTFHPV